MRLDRWFKAHFPALSHGVLQKMLRTGQVRVDGSRAKANHRLEHGQAVRVPPLPDDRPVKRRKRAFVSPEDQEFVRGLVVHMDDEVIALNKPPGLAVQGGTKTERHLDAMLEALRYEKPDAPRLVHRLDRDTSGLIVLARTRKAATWLGKAFKSRSLKKVYWALVAGAPRPQAGLIDMPLVKAGKAGDQRVRPARDGERDAQAAVTIYQTIEQAGQRASFLALWPRTGRTHQLRVHMSSIGYPILGDRKYGGEAAFLGEGAPDRLQLHARTLELPLPNGRTLDLNAPLPAHMETAFAFFGFEPSAPEAFAEDIQ